MTPSLRRLALFSAAACSLALPLDSARAALSGFSAFTLTQGSTSSAPAVRNGTNTTLTITTQGGGDFNSGFGTAAQSVGNGFSAAFQYQVTNTSGGNPGDGITFTLENSSSGASAVGTGGSGLGYSGITPSVGLAFDIYSTTANKVALCTGGTIGTYNNIGLNISGGDLIQMNISYMASTTALTLTVKDLTTSSATQTFNFTTNVNTDLAGGTLPTGQAYVGFTGGSGGNTSTQVISAFSAAPEPGTWTMIAAGAGALLAVQAKRRRVA